MDLTSHHVNYLIWRYLQESGHGEAAVMLQRAWLANPQTLPFASHIKSHALVSLVQKGLQYHEIEQSLDQDGNPIPFTPSKSFFGPTPLDPESLKVRDETIKAQSGLSTATAMPVPPANKPVPEPGVATNGHPVTEAPLPPLTVKKGRKSHRAEPVTNGDDSAMEIDTNGIGHDRVSAPPTVKSPSSAGLADAEGDINMDLAPAVDMPHENQETPVDTLTAGRSVGVQYVPAKAHDLSANTTILDVDVARDDHVTRSAWRPYDSSILASAGLTVCSLYKLSPSSTEKIYDNKDDGSWVTAMSWEPSGQKLALATFNEGRSSIQMYDSSGNVVDLLPTASGMINALHWAPKGTHMVVCSSNKARSELSVWDDSIKPEEFPSYQTLDGHVHDITWADDNHVFASGVGSVWQCEIDSTLQMQVVNRYQSREANAEWDYVRGVQTTSGPVAVAAESSARSLWIPTHDILLEDAHRADITGIEVRPKQQNQDANTSTSFTFASASVDDTVKVWTFDVESKKLTRLHTLFLSPGLPALALAFSPDGWAVAAASTDRFFIWNTDRGGEPVAIWTSPTDSTTEDPGRPVNGENGSGSVDRTIAWDADGKKIAMGYGKKIAVVNLHGRV